MAKKVKQLLVCNSNMFIPTVMTETLGNPKEHYLVISDTKSISKFFAFMAIPNVDYIEYGCTQGGFKFIEKKKELYGWVNKYDIDEVVFFHAEWGEMANWLIKKLSKAVPIKYCKIYDPIPAPRSRNWKQVIRIKLQQWIWWGMDVDVLELPQAFPSLPESFYKKIKAETIQIPVNCKLVSDYVSVKLDGLNLNVNYVLLTGTIVSDGLEEANSYTELTNKVIEIVGKHNIVSKCHPRYNDLYGMEQELPQIPSFIPGNVLINNYKCFIGYESTLLVEAAAAGKKSISMMYFLNISDETKQRWVDFFDSRLQGRGKVLLPKTWDEFSVLINS